MAEGFVVWFTGLPSAGKSTLARLLETELQRRARPVEVLDGDEVRKRLTKGLGFSKEDRDENIRRIAFVARLLAQHGVAAITAAISPYRGTRDEARREIARFVEVYVKCPLDTCVARDVKGLYRRALAGEISNFTGISDPYEEPPAPEVTVETDRESAEESVGTILARLAELGYLTPARADGAVDVPVPAYLFKALEEKLGSQRSPAHYLVDLLAGVLKEDETVLLTPADRARIEARLADLGYLER